jgi:hypothetical protein
MIKMVFGTDYIAWVDLQNYQDIEENLDWILNQIEKDLDTLVKMKRITKKEASALLEQMDLKTIY